MYLIIIALLGVGNAEQFTLLLTTTDPKLKQNKKSLCFGFLPVYSRYIPLDVEQK